MEEIFGVYCRNDCTLPPLTQHGEAKIVIGDQNLREFSLHHGDGIVLGHSLNDPETVSTHGKPVYFQSSNIAFVAVGRIDNPAEICASLNIPLNERSRMSDYDLILMSYLALGEECPSRLYGDWAFAAWHPVERRLFIARSHYGSVPLYYHIDCDRLVFSSSRQLLLKMKLTPFDLNELWLAQRLVSWAACYGEQTAYKQIKLLRPGHFLEVTETDIRQRRYWQPENLPELRLPRREDYVEGFRAVFDQAVACRLRSSRPIAATLSGGLDSGSVAATAAHLLAQHGDRLTAFTSVPCYDTDAFSKERFGDEWPFAKAVADHAGNIDLVPLRSAETTPIQAIRWYIASGSTPSHAAGNVYWLMDLQQSAKEMGCDVLLTGAAGNGGVSWSGDVFSQTLGFLLNHVERRWLIRALGYHASHRIKSMLPYRLLKAILQRRMERRAWCRSSAINPVFAGRIGLLEQWLNDPETTRFSLDPKAQQASILMLGKAVFGGYLSENGTNFGLELRDPTADARVLEFVLAVPDRIFIDPQSGMDRWLIREAMRGRLPDEVRLNRRRGLQAADLTLRLRSNAGEMAEALDELSRGPAAEFVDCDYMRQVWQMVQTKDTPEAFSKAGKILMRGLMVGLFINNFYE